MADWPLKTPPADYLEQWPEGPNADLAREILEADQEEVTEAAPDGPVAIRYLRYTPHEGHTIAPGRVLEVSPETAERRVAEGVAEYV